MPNGLTSIIHKKILQNFKDVGGQWKNDPSKILVQNVKQRWSKFKKNYSQVLVEQTVVLLVSIPKFQPVQVATTD